LTGDERDPCLRRFRPGALQTSRTTQRTDGIRLLGVVDQTMEPTKPHSGSDAPVNGSEGEEQPSQRLDKARPGHAAMGILR
jgi:hypothetical protein